MAEALLKTARVILKICLRRIRGEKFNDPIFEKQVGPRLMDAVAMHAAGQVFSFYSWQLPKYSSHSILKADACGCLQHIHKPPSFAHRLYSQYSLNS